MDEFERVARLREYFEPQRTAGVLLGIGDDAAVLARFAQNLVLSVDTAVQGVHFRPEFADWETLGARAFVAALSDLAGMGAQPRAALTALILPPELGDAEFDALNRGLARAAAHYRCPVVGGNLSRGGELSITTTVIGEVPGLGLTRQGAHSGDDIYVTGTLGAAALGLALLEAREPERSAPCVARWREPTARIAEGCALALVASAAIDVSDGLLQDLAHLCEASRVGAELEAELLPVLPGFDELARSLGRDPVALALSGGEDYELIFTLAPGGHTDVARSLGTRIGRVTAQPGEIVVRDALAEPVALSGRGYRHFGG